MPGRTTIGHHWCGHALLHPAGVGRWAWGPLWGGPPVGCQAWATIGSAGLGHWATISHWAQWNGSGRYKKWGLVQMGVWAWGQLACVVLCLGTALPAAQVVFKVCRPSALSGPPVAQSGGMLTQVWSVGPNAGGWGR